MVNAWVPEHPVDASLARRLVFEQFPDLATGEPIHLGSGWDADVWRFGDLAFRFPRRSMGVELIAVELRVLPVLAPRLPIRIPLPRYVGRPSEAFAAPFYGHELVAGTPADVAGLDDTGRGALAAPLGRFLRTLHDQDPAGVGAPDDKNKWDMTKKARSALSRLPALERSGVAGRVAEIAGLLASPPAGVPNTLPRLLHGDLYVRHLILGGPGELSGVIDWGDVRSGDPALDLAVAYSFLPARSRSAFWDAYGAVDAATRDRARFAALSAHGVSLLAYALDVDNRQLIREAERSVNLALEPDPV